jgi:ketol-acid reductoisomerase
MTVAVLGYGAQGHAHALNLRDSGVNVLVAQRPGSPRFEAAVRAGFEPVTIPEAVDRADLLIFALPDDATPKIYREQIEPRLRSGQTLGFIHGFNIHYQQVIPPAQTDVVLVAPKAAGDAVRQTFLNGGGVFALLAVYQNASGHALDTALGWAAALGCHRAGLWLTSFAHETETDLFGEQAVLCGGLTALIKAGFDTLVEAGYPPELAYFECCHEIKIIADLIHRGGLSYMHRRISSTARYGDLTRGPRVIGPAVRQAMREILSEIRSGQFAREFLAESARGFPTIASALQAERQHPIEEVGSRLRSCQNLPENSQE